MLGERTHHAVTSEQQGERLDDGGLPTIVRTDQHAVLAESDVPGPNPSEILNTQIGDLHGRVPKILQPK
jgi:hypothetical protein